MLGLIVPPIRSQILNPLLSVPVVLPGFGSEQMWFFWGARHVMRSSTLMTELRSTGECAQSVHHEAIREAEKHKWIESQKRGYDVGESALAEWCHNHWADFYHHRYMQHLDGEICWKEFPRQKFGLLKKNPVEDRRTLERFASLMIRKDGGENLCIINSELDCTPRVSERMMKLLELIDINSDRLSPPFPW